MERLINLPDVEAVREFVNGARLAENIVLVSKEGYKFQIDGASILGMMSVIGQNLRVSCLGNAEKMRPVLERYSVVS